MQTNQFLYTQLPHKEDYSYCIDYIKDTFLWYLLQGGNKCNHVAYTGLNGV
jgi:hypothetical protein